MEKAMDPNVKRQLKRDCARSALIGLLASQGRGDFDYDEIAASAYAIGCCLADEISSTEYCEDN